MDEQVLDASAIDNLNDYELTGEPEDFNQEEESQPKEDFEQSSNDEELNQTEPDQDPDSDDDFTKEVLRLKGISDPNKIKFEDESGAIIERAWNDLTTNEKLGI